MIADEDTSRRIPDMVNIFGMYCFLRSCVC